MFVHEYQAKNLLNQLYLKFPPGNVAFSAEEAGSVAEAIDASAWAVKAQILAGDRGRFGGVHVANSISDVVHATKNLLGSVLVTPQTGASGLAVEAVYIERACEIERELYLAVILDRYNRELVLLASDAGGTDIEKVLRDNPDSLYRSKISISQPPNQNELKQLALSMGLNGQVAEQYVTICSNLYAAIDKLDALSIELNPLALTTDGELVALDVKLEIDDNALFRHEEFQEIRDRNRLADEKRRVQSGYNYVQLEGDIGLVVGGAGLALATMDLLKEYSLSPANFLDLPPVASRRDVADACDTVLQTPSLKALLVNVVGGGLTHCDTVAEGLITVNNRSPIACPVVVRFAGTKKEHGVTLLKNSKVPFQLANTMNEAVKQLLRIR